VRRQERCLLAILLLNPGQVVPLDRLSDLLWDGEPPQHAHRAVRSQIAHLRAALATAEVSDGALQAHGNGCT
jgi:SARP family transcriptional regulator, regulator of embCAB operon